MRVDRYEGTAGTSANQRRFPIRGAHLVRPRPKSTPPLLVIPSLLLVLLHELDVCASSATDTTTPFRPSRLAGRATLIHSVTLAVLTCFASLPHRTGLDASFSSLILTSILMRFRGDDGGVQISDDGAVDDEPYLRNIGASLQGVGRGVFGSRGDKGSRGDCDMSTRLGWLADAPRRLR